MGKIIKAEKRGGGIESKVIEEYTLLVQKLFEFLQLVRQHGFRTKKWHLLSREAARLCNGGNSG